MSFKTLKSVVKGLNVTSNEVIFHEMVYRHHLKVLHELSWASSAGYIPVEDFEEQLNMVRHTKAILNREKRLNDKILHIMIEKMDKCNTFEVFENRIKNNKVCRIRYVYCDMILAKLRLLNIERLDFLKQQRVARQISLDYIKNNKHDFRFLECEDFVDFEDATDEEVLSVESLDLQSNYKRYVYKENQDRILQYFMKQVKKEKVREQPIRLFPNIFLLDRIHSIIESFRRMRMPQLNLFRREYSFANSPREIQRNWYEMTEIPMTSPHPIIEPDSILDIDDLGEIEYAEEVFPEMDEDTSQCIYSKDYIVFSKLKKKQVVENQMERENPHGDCDQLVAEQKGNVILTTHVEEPSRTQPVTVTPGIWEELCSPQKIAEYTQLMSRWQRIQTTQWSVDDVIGHNLFVKPMSLPRAYIETLQDSPSCILFKTYSYFRSDIEIKVVVNTNKFHCGQLQASFYYGASLDSHYNDRENIFSASQLPHAIIDAACATDAILMIPYRHYKPLMATTKRADDNIILDLGVLRLLVLNQLQAPGEEKPIIDVSVFMRFVKPSFHGMKPRDIGDIVENQMMGMATLIKETANLVNQIYPDPQRDNPSDILPPKTMVPWSAHSWCVGDMLPEPINPLRLQATGNTPHLPGTIPSEPEMTLKYIQETYGLIQQIKWSTSDPEGKILCKIPFSPVLDKYPTTTLRNPTTKLCDVMPPVSVLANLFAYWRGSLEYRLDFVSTQFHTGRLIIAYLPRVVAGDKISILQLTYCDHVIVDLRNEKEVNYINSFLSDKPWYPRRSFNKFSTEVFPPGYIYIGVLTNLTATSAVADNVNINMYLRAGKDFELHIPVSPSIALSYNTDMTIPSNNVVTYINTYGPPYTSMYIGRWHSTSDGLLLRYGPGSDHITQFKLKDVKKGRVLRCNKDLVNNFIYTDGATYGYMVLFKLDENYAYGAVFSKFTDAQTFANLLNNNGIANAEALAKMAKGSTDGAYMRQDIYYQWRDTTTLDEFEIVEAQAGDDQRMNDCGMNVDVQSPLRSTSAGLLTFGEQITNIKQLIRRYMPYCVIQLQGTAKSDPALADIAIPVLPQGLDLMTKTTKGEYMYGNRIRDGPIPILASGYRFYRGSIRFRMIVSGQKEGVFWVQHRPEYNLRSLTPYTPDATYSEALYQPGYGYMIQLTKMNNVLEFEVPFYLPGQFGMLQRPNLTVVEDAVHYSLGTLYCGFDIMGAETKNVPTNIMVFYSMGDDMTFSVFQGFPPMLDITVFDKPPVALAEGPLEFVKNKFSGSIRESVKNEIVAVLQTTADNINEDGTTKATLPIAPTTDRDIDILDLIKKIFPDMDESKKLLMVNIFSNIVHCAISPKISTIAWSIANMFVIAGCVCMSFVERICNTLKNLLKALVTTKNSKKSEGESIAVSNGPGDNDTSLYSPQVRDEAAFVSTCIAGILAVAGASNKPLPKNVPDFAKYLYEGLPKFSLSANGLFIFLRNNITMFKKIWFWIISKWDKNYVLFTELAGAPEATMVFVKQIQYCLDAQNLQRVRKDPKCTVMVYDLANKALAYLAKKAVTNVQKSMPLFEMYCKKIIKLRDELTQEMLSPAIRFEPYVVSFNGPSNVGKSHLANSIARQMMKSIDYTTYNELVYTRTPGNQYWNGLMNQPVCVFDDFLNIEDSMHSLVQIGELYCLKSKAVFNPPMAAIEEKKIRYNPLLVILCNNKAFPKIKGLSCDEAWRRRRDLLIEVRKIGKYKNVHPRDLPSAVKKSYGHLRFCCYTNPAGMSVEEQKLIKPDDPTEEYKDWMTWGELNAYIGGKFIEYFEEECIQYDDAITQLRNFHPDLDESTEEFCARVTKRTQELNDGRTSQDELEFLNNVIKSLNDNKYTDDMTSYVKKSIISKQIEDTQAKQEKHKETVARIKGSSQGKKWASEEQTVEIKAQVHVDAIVTAEGPGEVEENGPIASGPTTTRVWGSLDGSLAEKWYPYIKDFLPADKEFYVMKVVHHISKFYEPHDWIKFCDCAKRLAFTQQLQPSDSANKIFGIAIYSKCLKPRGVSTEDFPIEPCGTSCSLLDRDFLKIICSKSFVPKFNEVNRRYMHPDIKKMLEEKKPETIELMTMAEVDAHIAQEVLDKKWYQKLWESVPSFGTIFKFLCKLGALVAALGAVIRVSGYFFGAADHAAATVTQSKCEKQYWENNLMIENMLQVDLGEKKLVGYHDSEALKFEEGAYSVGIKAATSGVAAPHKIFQNASEQQELVVQSHVRRNTFWILAEYEKEGEVKRKFFRCLGLVNRHFIILDHYIYFLQSCAKLRLTMVREQLSVRIPLESVFDLKRLVCSSICIGTLPKVCPQFRNIIPMIATRDASRNMSPQAVLLEMKLNPENGDYTMKESHFARIKVQQRLEVLNDDGSTTHVSTSYAYPYAGRGVCGSVLATRANTVSPIIGIHVAGLKDGSEGYSEAITREYFQPLLDMNEPCVEPNSAYDEISRDDDPIMGLDGNVELLGVIPRKAAQHPATKSRLVHTECAGAFGDITYEIPVLSRHDERIVDNPFSPLQEGCYFHTNPCFPMEEPFVQRAVEDMQNKILSTVIPQRMNVGRLSVNEAIEGFPGIDGYDGMAMDTSEGFPWILSRPKGMSNKSWMFDFEMINGNKKLVKMDYTLTNVLQMKEDKRKQGICFETVFVDTLKDAKLPKEKVLKPGKTRIFSVSPVDFTIQLRQYSLDFSAAYTKARIESEHAVGIDMNSLETNKLVERMLEYGNNHVCGDYSKFGDQLYASLVYAVYEIIIKWYQHHGVTDPTFAMVLKCFAEETMNAVHLMLNLLYKSLGGMPSGNPLTVIINSIVNSCYVRVVWQKIMIKVSLRYISMASFHENVRIVTYGDDLWLSVKDEVKDVFNAVTMAEAFATYNIRFTNATKGDEMIPYASITSPEVTFLKRTFHKHERRPIWVARLEERVVLESSNWTWNTQKDNRAASIEACKQMLELSYGHGKSYYENLRQKVTTYWMNKSVFTSFPDWESIDMRIYDH